MSDKTIDIFNITELQHRKVPKKDQSFELKLHGKIATATATDVDEGDGDGDGDGEGDKKQHKVIFKDKRKSSTNLVDRELILKRLKMNIPVEKILISQAPVQPEKQQVKQRAQVAFDEDSELHDEMKRLEERSEDEKIAEIVEDEIEEAIQDGTEKSIDEEALIPIQDTITEEDEEKGKGKKGKDTVKKPRGKKKVADFVAEVG
jgi:hypothetical protein